MSQPEAANSGGYDTRNDALDRCDCGHLRGHHNTYRDNVYYLAHTRCNFKGCGCPKFLVGPVLEVLHACPPGDSGIMPCCGRTPFEIPRTDRLTTDKGAVTCGRN